MYPTFLLSTMYVPMPMYYSQRILLYLEAGIDDIIAASQCHTMIPSCSRIHSHPSVGLNPLEEGLYPSEGCVHSNLTSQTRTKAGYTNLSVDTWE